MDITPPDLNAINKCDRHDLKTATGLINFQKYFESEKVIHYSDRCGAVEKIKVKCKVLWTSTQKPDELFYIALLLHDCFVVTDIAKVNTNAFISNCVGIAFELVHNKRKTSRFPEVFEEGSDDAQFTRAEEKVSDEIAAAMHEGLESEKLVSPFEYIEFVRSLVHVSDTDDIDQIKELIVISREDANFAKFRPSVIAASAMFAFTSNQYKSALEGFRSKLLKLEFFNEPEVTECQELMEILYGQLHVKGDRLGYCGEMMELKASSW